MRVWVKVMVSTGVVWDGHDPECEGQEPEKEGVPLA